MLCIFCKCEVWNSSLIRKNRYLFSFIYLFILNFLCEYLYACVCRVLLFGLASFVCMWDGGSPSTTWFNTHLQWRLVILHVRAYLTKFPLFHLETELVLVNFHMPLHSYSSWSGKVLITDMWPDQLDAPWGCVGLLDSFIRKEIIPELGEKAEKNLILHCGSVYLCCPKPFSSKEPKFCINFIILYIQNAPIKKWKEK